MIKQRGILRAKNPSYTWELSRHCQVGVKEYAKLETFLAKFDTLRNMAESNLKFPNPVDIFFQPWEIVVKDWESALKAINLINSIVAPNLDPKKSNWVWRGQSSAKDPLHSFLYRQISRATKKRPNEFDMLTSEETILNRSRADWRFDNLCALEIMAQIQHHGGPTRLLDVSFNPLVALWFAVEQGFEKNGRSKKDELDGRMFAFNMPENLIQLDEIWGTRKLPWAEDEKYKWKTEQSFCWRPPNYNDRIPAQNAAFLVSGVPMAPEKEYIDRGFEPRSYYEDSREFQDNILFEDERRRSYDDSYLSNYPKSYELERGMGRERRFWRIGEVRRVTSVALKMYSTSSSMIENWNPESVTPTLTMRIKADCKSEIRYALEEKFGYSSSSMYPDISGLAKNVANGIFE